jgi:hypothetical protein
MKVRILFILTVLLVTSGCYFVKNYSVSPVMQSGANNEYFKASINVTGKSPMAGYAGFILTVQNLSDEDITIDWNRTYYINNQGMTQGTFMFSGMRYMQKDQPKAPDVVFKKGYFSKVIYPASLASYNSTTGWGNYGMGTGTMGVYLTARVGDKDITQKLLVNVYSN